MSSAPDPKQGERPEIERFEILTVGGISKPHPHTEGAWVSFEALRAVEGEREHWRREAESWRSRAETAEKQLVEAGAERDAALADSIAALAKLGEVRVELERRADDDRYSTLARMAYRDAADLLAPQPSSGTEGAADKLAITSHNSESGTEGEDCEECKGDGEFCREEWFTAACPVCNGTGKKPKSCPNAHLYENGVKKPCPDCKCNEKVQVQPQYRALITVFHDPEIGSDTPILAEAEGVPLASVVDRVRAGEDVGAVAIDFGIKAESARLIVAISNACSTQQVVPSEALGDWPELWISRLAGNDALPPGAPDLFWPGEARELPEGREVRRYIPAEGSQEEGEQ